jgi:hypothetical protein
VRELAGEPCGKNERHQCGRRLSSVSEVRAHSLGAATVGEVVKRGFTSGHRTAFKRFNLRINRSITELTSLVLRIVDENAKQFFDQSAVVLWRTSNYNVVHDSEGILKSDEPDATRRN